MPFNDFNESGKDFAADTSIRTVILGSNQNILVQGLKITNVTSNVETVRLFYDPTGTTADETTALLWDTPIEPGIVFDMDFGGVGLPFIGGGSLKIQASTGNAINIMTWARTTDYLAGINFKTLGQIRNGTTSPINVYTMGDLGIEHTAIKAIVACNVTSLKRRYSFYVDGVGSTFNNTTKVFHELHLGGNSTDIWIEPGEGILLDDKLASAAFQSDLGNAINYTLLGIEHQA